MFDETGGLERRCPVVSELFGNEGAFSNIGEEVEASSSKIPWKIRAARKRSLKHHTTGMTKDEFAQIKKSLCQSATTCESCDQADPKSIGSRGLFSFR